MALPKWTDERTKQLTDIVGTESPVSLETVAKAAEAAMADFKNAYDSDEKGVEHSDSANLGTVSVDDDGTTVTIITCWDTGCASDVVSTNTVAIE